MPTAYQLPLSTDLSSTMASIQCDGCNVKFSLPGFSRHLSQTSNLQCIAIYQKSQTYRPSTVPGRHEASTSRSEMEVDDIQGQALDKTTQMEEDWVSELNGYNFKLTRNDNDSVQMRSSETKMKQTTKVM